MYISTRAACRLLVRKGVSSWSAQHVLRSGLAGDPIDAGRVVLYEKARVLELAARPTASWPEVHERCQAGLFVSRRDFPATGTREDQLAALSEGWGAVNMWHWVSMHSQVVRCGALPFVATVGGLVVLGADIVGTYGLSGLVLEPPGPWFGVVEGRWLPTGPGRPWVLSVGAPAPERIGA